MNWGRFDLPFSFSLILFSLLFFLSSCKEREKSLQDNRYALSAFLGKEFKLVVREDVAAAVDGEHRTFACRLSRESTELVERKGPRLRLRSRLAV